MSKKLAEDLDGLVLDVKHGSGAFMADATRAHELAETMVAIGASYGLETVALLTGMDVPLGREVGNASEIRESIDVLRGDGPPDLVEVTLALGVEMLILGGVASGPDDARRMLDESLASGRALDAFTRVIEAQGGDPAVIEDPTLLPSAPRAHEVVAPEPGVVTRCDARRLGVAAMRLGAGRERKEDTIDPGVGITLIAKPGDTVERGDVLGRIAYRHTARLGEALRILEGSWEIGASAPPVAPLVTARIVA
jgi:thymidine phosphorylase